jgi:hypothetical protein
MQWQTTADAKAKDKVDIAVDASWVGTDQVRYVRGLDRDDLSIETAPGLGPDGMTKHIAARTAALGASTSPPHSGGTASARELGAP